MHPSQQENDPDNNEGGSPSVNRAAFGIEDMEMEEPDLENPWGREDEIQNEWAN